MPAASVEVAQLRGYALVQRNAPEARLSQLRAMAAANYPADAVEVSQMFTSMAGIHSMFTEVSQLRVLALIRGDVDRHRIRTWTFSLHGHQFFVLRLGIVDTLVYDYTTKRWSSWKTLGLNYWRAHTGMNWENEIVAGDTTEGLLWDISAEAYMDDTNVAIERVVTGGHPMRLRGALACNGVMVTGSVGHHQGSGVTITLRTSDDNGATYDSHGSIELGDPGDFKDEIVWRSLGTIHAPGRIFEITDTGVATRIDGLDMW